MSIESYCEQPMPDQFKQTSAALPSFIHREDSPKSSGAVTGFLGAPSSVPTRHPSGDQRPLSSRHDENFLSSNGLNPGAILLLGNFQNC